METNAVTKVVTDEISITAKFISDLKMFAITKGLDLVESIILFIIGYILCRYIRKAAEHILEKSNVDPSAKTFISERLCHNKWLIFDEKYRIIIVRNSTTEGGNWICLLSKTH